MPLLYLNHIFALGPIKVINSTYINVIVAALNFPYRDFSWRFFSQEMKGDINHENIIRISKCRGLNESLTFFYIVQRS